MIMNKLKELRKETKLYQKDIGKILNMSQTGYSQYEIETNDIPTIILRKISNHYNVSIDYILGITTIRNSYSKSIINIDNNLKILNRLKDIREDRDLTQLEIAKVLQMSRSGYSQYETGVNDIPTKILIKLAYFYNVSIDYLLYMTDDRKCHSKIKEI